MLFRSNPFSGKSRMLIKESVPKFVKEEVIENSIVGQIHGGKPGKTVLMRADMDALPIQENTKNLCCDKLCVSKNDGISHACGHDSHTAMLLGEAKILNEHKDELNGNIVLCFERGEE